MGQVAVEEAVSRFVFSCNFPFSTVDHLEFQRLVVGLRPGTKPFSSRRLCTTQLDAVYNAERAALAKELNGKDVTLKVDGWSTSQCLPVLGISVEDALIEAMETVGDAHTSEFLLNLVERAIGNIEGELGVRVVAIVSDSACNMLLMRQMVSAKRKVLCSL